MGWSIEGSKSTSARIVTHEHTVRLACKRSTMAAMGSASDIHKALRGATTTTSFGLRKHGCQMSATHSTYSSSIAALTKTLIATSTSVMMCLARRTAANDPSLHGSADR